MLLKNHVRLNALNAAMLIALAALPMQNVEAKRGTLGANQVEPASVDTISAKQAVYVPNFVAKAGSLEAQAREFLRAARGELSLPHADQDLVKDSERNVGDLRVVRFAQMHQGYPVRDSQLDVTVDRDGKIIFVANGYRRIDGSGSKRAIVAVDAARDAA